MEEYRLSLHLLVLTEEAKELRASHLVIDECPCLKSFFRIRLIYNEHRDACFSIPSTRTLKGLLARSKIGPQVRFVLSISSALDTFEFCGLKQSMRGLQAFQVNERVLAWRRGIFVRDFLCREFLIKCVSWLHGLTTSSVEQILVIVFRCNCFYRFALNWR